MELELYQIIVLLGIGVVAGISMSIVGQTGQGIIVPLVFLFTGDILLAIAVSLLNDFFAAITASRKYIQHKNVVLNRSLFMFLIVALTFSLFGSIILIFTDVRNSFNWLVPSVTLVIGIFIAVRGFPTSESLKKMVHKITEKRLKDDKSEDEIRELEEEMDEQLESGKEINPLFDPSSKIFYVLTVVAGIIIGLLCGLFGISGGANLVFVLVLIFGYPIKKAVGSAIISSISLIIITFSSLQILSFIALGHLYFDLAISFYLGISTVITGLIASKYVQKIPGKILGQIVGIMMIMVSTVTLIIVLTSF